MAKRRSDQSASARTRLDTGISGGAAAVERLLRPRSVAVIGASSRPNSAGYNVLNNLRMGRHDCKILLVSRSCSTIAGHPCLSAISELPEDVDLAILTLPSGAVREAVEECVRRKVRSAVVFAAGFSEIGPSGLREQTDISAIASSGRLFLLGPNCLGFSNQVDGLPVSFLDMTNHVAHIPTGTEGVAILGQSGLLVSHVRDVLEARKLTTSYFVTTGNEAGLGLADFLDYFAADISTRTIAVFAECVRHPSAFLAAVAKARDSGKAIVMLHTGRSARAKAAARAHTGALTVDYPAMRLALENAGVAMVDTLEEIIDVTDILTRFPQPPTKGVGIVTFSGAFCGLSHDFCADLGLDIPPISSQTADELRPQLPAFAPPANPLDLTTQPAWQPDLLGIGAKALLEDPATGSLVIATPIGTGEEARSAFNGLLPCIAGSTKPVVFGAITDGQPLPDYIAESISSERLSFIPSPERALRAIAKLTSHGNRLEVLRTASPLSAFSGLPALRHGTLPEWLSKQLLVTIGVEIPGGSLARTLEEAHEIAVRIGFPVVLKAQTSINKSGEDNCGVDCKIENSAELDYAWAQLHASVKLAEIMLDGALIEEVAPRGISLRLEARRDPAWGPMLGMGLCGDPSKEASDMKLMPANLTAEEYANQIQNIDGVKVFTNLRGGEEWDFNAAARTASNIGRLLLTEPAIQEIAVNPLILSAEGGGAIALNAHIVVDADS